jgi:hypothetical protein
VLQASSVTVHFEVPDFELVPSPVPFQEAGQHPEANRPGEGHLHARLDLQPVVVLEREEAYTFTNVPPGEHQLVVELTQNDHSPFLPPVVKEIRFRTTGPETMPETGQEAGGTAAGHLLLVLSVLLVSLGGCWCAAARGEPTPNLVHAAPHLQEWGQPGTLLPATRWPKPCQARYSLSGQANQRYVVRSMR